MELHTSGQYWDQRDLTELLALDLDGQNRYRSHTSDVDNHGHVYGGQLIAQTLWAAAQGLEGRSPSLLQMTFLNDASPLDTIEYSVELLQDGRCFSNRHIYGVQGTGLVLSANASFQKTSTDSGRVYHLDRLLPTPEGLPTLAESAASQMHQGHALRLRLIDRPVLDVRPIHAERAGGRPDDQPEVGYWVRLNQPLPNEGCLHPAALAYMSDCWLNRCLVPSPSMPDPWQHGRVSQLNHSLWFHSSLIDANDWLLFLSEPVRSLAGRGLVTTHIYQRYGRLVASMTQDMLLSPLVA